MLTASLCCKSQASCETVERKVAEFGGESPASFAPDHPFMPAHDLVDERSDGSHWNGYTPFG